MFCLIELGLVWFGLVWFVVVILGVLFDRTGFVLVWFGLLFSILIYYNEFDGDKADYWFRDWFAMSRNMTVLVKVITTLRFI